MIKRFLKWLLKRFLNVIRYLTRTIFNVIRYLAIAIFFTPALLYYISHHNGYYPYELLNNLSISIFLSALLGSAVSMWASELLTEPEYYNHSITRNEYQTELGTAPHWVKVKHQFSRKLDLTDEELASNAYIKDFISISILPIGIYFLFTNNPTKASNFPEYRWLEAAWALFIHYIAIPFGICIIFSIILFLVLNYMNQSDTERIWIRIKQWIAIMQKILFGNLILMTI